MADSTIPLGESPQKDITRAERDPVGVSVLGVCEGSVVWVREGTRV